MKIAFIGLGNMGGGMAANLVKAGHNVRAFDLSEDAIAKAKQAGCETFGSARAAAEGAEAVVSMLPNGEIVRDVYRTDIIGQAPEHAILIDCSTIDVATAREVATLASEKGYAMVDAPVSGGIAAADAGTLTFMVGGSADAFAKAEPVLQAMGKAVIHAGDRGQWPSGKNLQQYAARHPYDRNSRSVFDGRETRPRCTDILRYFQCQQRAKLVHDQLLPGSRRRP